MNGKHIIVTK